MVTRALPLTPTNNRIFFWLTTFPCEMSFPFFDAYSSHTILSARTIEASYKPRFGKTERMGIVQTRTDGGLLTRGCIFRHIFAVAC